MVSWRGRRMGRRTHVLEVLAPHPEFFAGVVVDRGIPTAARIELDDRAVAHPAIPIVGIVDADKRTYVLVECSGGAVRGVKPCTQCTRPEGGPLGRGRPL